MATNLYGSLDASIREIRILEIAPSMDATAPIKCKLHVVSLDSSTLPKYVALSYVWGDPKRTTQIEINGISCQVTTNLESALRHIRTPDEEVLLWADAACINQDDLEERSRQVLLMGSIFNTAEEVIAWLGEESADSYLALQLITQWAQWIRYRGAGDMELAEVEENVQHAFEEEAIAAIKSLGSRAYWTRIWVLQELVLARRITCLCGKIRLPFSDFRLAGSVWFKITHKYCEGRLDPRSLLYLSLWVTPLNHMLDAVSIFAPDSSLIAHNHAPTPELSLDLLLELQHLKATDPRDKIYGILGIVTSKTGYYSSPDYTKPVEDMFCEIAKDMLLANRNMKVAHYAATKTSPLNAPKLPSWVPEWGEGNTEVSLAHVVPWYRQSSSTLFNNYIRFTNNNRVLHCKGIILDRVDETYHKTIPFVGDEGIGIIIQKIVAGAPIGARSALQGFFRAISLDTYGYGLHRHRMIPSSTEYYAQAARFLKSMAGWMSRYRSSSTSVSIEELLVLTFVEGTDETHLEEELQLLSSEMDQELNTYVYEVHLTTVMSGRVPFRTTNSRMGVGASQVTPGDVICHLAGHSFPFVLHSEMDHYVVRGECFVSGVELPELTEDVVSAMQEFEIR